MKPGETPRSPWIIALMIAGFIVFLLWSAFQASHRGSEIIDRDYYSKGLKYNTTLLEKQAASVLGWAVSFALDQHTLAVRLVDQQRQPVTGGAATLFLYQAKAEAPLAIPLTETQPGTYQSSLPGQLSGELRARLDFHRQGARINRQLLLNF